MSLTTDDVNAVRAQWEEWVPDGFRLDIEVLVDDVVTEVRHGSGELMARLKSDSPLIQVEVFRREPWMPGEEREVRVFSDRIPCDGAMLRASVAVLARTIASHQENSSDEGEGGDA
jgi:hypothetical protein